MLIQPEAKRSETCVRNIQTTAEPFFLDVCAERVRQNLKWGRQRHADEKWLTILQEEIGEVAKAILEGEKSQRDTELVQVVAVVVAWVEDKMGDEHADST